MLSQSYRLRVGLAALAVVVLAALGGVGAAQSDQPDWGNSLYDNATEMVPTYNEQVEAADLGVAAEQLQGERVNLVVTDESTGETVTYSFRMDDSLRIQEFTQGSRDDATLRMSTTRATVGRINTADDPSTAFRSAIRSRDITIDGLTIVNSVKWTAINALGDALGFFE